MRELDCSPVLRSLDLCRTHALLVLISAASLSMAVVEVHQALLRKGMHAQVKTIVAGTLVSVLGAYAMFRWNLGLPPTTFAVICVCGTVIACLVARLLLAREGFIRDIAASALIIAYIPLMGVFIPLMMAEPGGTRRRARSTPTPRDRPARRAPTGR